MSDFALYHSPFTPHSRYVALSVPQQHNAALQKPGKPTLQTAGQGSRRSAWWVISLIISVSLRFRLNTGRLQALRLLLAGHRITLRTGDLERSPCAVPFFCLPKGESSGMTHCHFGFFFFNWIKSSTVNIWERHKCYLTDFTITPPRQTDAAIFGILQGIALTLSNSCTKYWFWQKTLCDLSTTLCMFCHLIC